MGKNFKHFMKIMKNENIGGLFKKSCFGYFLELPEDPSSCIYFPMMMVYGLLKCRIKYVGHDKDPKKGAKRKWMKSRSTTVACLFVLAYKSLP